MDLPVTVGTLGFIKVLKDLKEESLGIKQFTSDRYEHICKYMRETEEKKNNPSMFNLLSSLNHEIGYVHCHNGICFIVRLVPCFLLLTPEN